MINIKDAILEVEKKVNVSNGGSSCYDFGDVVLVEYKCENKYLRKYPFTREHEESIAIAVNKKADNGLNTPRHLEIQRLRDDTTDYCFVLQEKCPGKNWEVIKGKDRTIDHRIEVLEYMNSIPQEHYDKLYLSAIELNGLEYEPKPKNLFYDEKTGFWFIDFLNATSINIDKGNVLDIFQTVKYCIPTIYSLLPYIYNYDGISEEEIKIDNYLLLEVKKKMFLAATKAYPILREFAYFYLINEDDMFKHYLVEQKVINEDEITFNAQISKKFEAAKNAVIESIINGIVNGQYTYNEVLINQIRMKSDILNLFKVYCNHPDNPTILNEDKYEFEYQSNKNFENMMMESIVKKLRQMDSNNYINDFLSNVNTELLKSI